MKKGQKKLLLPLFLTIIVLIFILIIVCTRYISMQNRLTAQIETTAQLEAKIDDLSVQLQKAEEALLEAENNSAPQEEDEDSTSDQSELATDENHPEPAPAEGDADEEGTLSPSDGSDSILSNQADVDELMAQVHTLLPSSNGSWSVFCADVTNGGEASINNSPMQAASLIKLYIMGAVFENYDSLCASYGASAVNGNLSSMITVSDNEAANQLTIWLGGGNAASGRDAVTAFCRSHGYQATSMGRMLLADKSTGDNYTSVNDCGHFLQEVYAGAKGSAEVSLSHCAEMFSLLSQQQRRNKIPAQMPSGVGVANKTGELSDVENDAAIIYNTANNIDLVLVFMSQNLSQPGSAQTSIASISRQMYGYFNET